LDLADDTGGLNVSAQVQLSGETYQDLSHHAHKHPHAEYGC